MDCPSRAWIAYNPTEYENTFCVRSKKPHTSAASGDSGTPVTCKHEPTQRKIIIGIVKSGTHPKTIFEKDYDNFFTVVTKTNAHMYDAIDLKLRNRQVYKG